MIDVFILLVIFQEKHFLCDYPFQTSYMLRKFQADWGFVKPLAAHAGVHACFTLAIGTIYGLHTIPVSKIVLLALFDFAVHFTMDRLKAGPKYLGRFKALSASEFGPIKRGSIYEGDNQELLMFKRNCQKNLRDNTYFWWSLGLDQKIHHLTHYFIIWKLVT